MNRAFIEVSRARQYLFIITESVRRLQALGYHERPEIWPYLAETLYALVH